MRLHNYTIYMSWPGKARGLMFSPKRTIVLDNKEEMITSLHMLFVFFPIDVFFLDKQKKIVEVKRNFKPFTFYTSRKKAQFVVEIPSSYNAKAKIGTAVKFK